MAVINPAAELELGRLHCASVSYLDDALDAAEKGFCIWSAGEAMRTYGRIIPTEKGHKFSVHHHPIGVVTAISP